MRQEVSELERKRAVNQIWNGAGDHGFSPDFKAYDAEGHAELYWNTIIGALRRHYDYALIEPIFLAFQQYEDNDIYESLLWLGLENAVFGREVVSRPILSSLRLDYAKRMIARTSIHFDSPWHEKLIYAHYAKVAGEEFPLDARSRKLLNQLEFPPKLDTEELVARARELFMQWLQISTETKAKRRGFLFPGLLRKKQPKGRYRPFGIGFADHPRNLYGAKAESDEELLELKTSMNGAELRAFMSAKFGASIYSDRENRQLESELCTGNHAFTHLLITRGERAEGKIQNGFEALKKQAEAAQKQKNRAYAKALRAQNSTAVAALSARIQNSMLQHLQPLDVKSTSGRLQSARVWRAAALDDAAVFDRTEQNDMGDLSVDILLDASTSQENRLETISNQAYVIAESMNRCGIPCRVSSFCSMTGYTILHIFRDYQETNRNESIFDFVANGCNRDGLAVRTICRLMRENVCEHRLLIILSDVKPNDIVKTTGNGEAERVPYQSLPGLTDTALEVRRARAEGISVICVFTGDDEDLPSAKLVYGRDFARIRSVQQMAETVGKLIQNQIDIL